MRVESGLIVCLACFLALNMSVVIGAQSPSTISISVSPSTLTIGGTVKVSGSVSPGVAGVTVTIVYTRPDGTMLTRNTTTSLISTFGDSYLPDVVGEWTVSASWSGNSDYSGATSSSESFVVNALSSGTSSITCITDYSSVPIGTSVHVTGKLIPTESASIVLEFSSDGGNSWSSLTTVNSTSDGTYQYTWTPASPGSYLLRARWQGDSSHAGATSTSVSVFVHGLPPDFQFSISPNSLSIQQGALATMTVTITSENGFSSPVSLAATNLPSGMAITFSQNPVTTSSGGTSSSTATVTVSTLAPQGTYTVAISANGGGLTKQASVTVAITAQCFIATATFGSAMSPEVQILREFRDNQVQHTFAGANFMRVFNAWYYSFSPTVAKFIAHDDGRRAVMRILLYPLIDILRIGSGTYSTLIFSPELAILACGIIVSLLIGMVYMTLPAFAIALVAEKRLRTKSLLALAKCLLALNLCAIGFLASSEALSIPIAMMFTSSLVVLTGMASGGLLMALAILKMLRSLPFSHYSTRT